MNRVKVMICDSDVAVVEKLQAWIKNSLKNFEVVGTACDGIAAWNAACKLHPDLMIMDIDLPVKSGLDVIKELTQVLPDLLFIVASKNCQYSYIRAVLKLGVFDYILKPLNMNELHQVLEDARLELMERRVKIEPASRMEEDNLIYQVVEYINEHISEEITLAQLGNVFHINPYYLSQVFKASTGINYHAYLTRVRLQKSKQLLLSTDFTIAQISDIVGYSNYRVFTKAFGKEEGITPSKYRADNKYTLKFAACVQASRSVRLREEYIRLYRTTDRGEACLESDARWSAVEEANSPTGEPLADAQKSIDTLIWLDLKQNLPESKQ